jgi:hypothetical protein
VTAATLLAAALAAAASAAPARPLSLLARAERSEVRLGEPFGYEIEVRHAPAERYAIPPDLDAPPFRGAGGACRREAHGDEVRTTCAIRLALFALGPHDVPELALSVESAEGAATLAVPGPRVSGVGVIDPAAPAEGLALRPLAPPVPLVVPSLRVLGWAAAAAALLLTALLARRALRARARAGLPLPPPEAPGARLARRLDALEAEGLAARGRGREHVAAVSAIAREWLGAVTGVNALDLTTAELCERLARADDPRVDLSALRRFCEDADLVKYARAPAGPAECAAATAFARGLAAAPAREAAGERGATPASGADRTEGGGA